MREIECKFVAIEGKMMDIDGEVTEKSQRSEGEVEEIEGEVTDEF